MALIRGLKEAMEKSKSPIRDRPEPSLADIIGTAPQVQQ